jgi:hypothetical protein
VLPSELILDLRDACLDRLNDRADAGYLSHHSPFKLTSTEPDGNRGSDSPTATTTPPRSPSATSGRSRPSRAQPVRTRAPPVRDQYKILVPACSHRRPARAEQCATRCARRRSVARPDRRIARLRALRTPGVRRPVWPTSERGSIRAGGCFALAEHASAEACPTHLVLVPCDSDVGVCGQFRNHAPPVPRGGAASGLIERAAPLAAGNPRDQRGAELAEVGP